MTRELDGKARSICVERRGWEARDESWRRAGTILKGSRQCEKKDDELENSLQKRETPQRGPDRPVMDRSYDKSSKAWLGRMDRAGPSARRWGPFMESHLRGSMMSLLLSMEEEISSEEESEDRVKMEQLLSLSFLTALGLGVIRSSTRFPGLFLWLPQRVLSMWKQMRKNTQKRETWTPVCLSIPRGRNESPLKFPFITKSTKLRLLLSQVCGSNWASLPGSTRESSRATFVGSFHRYALHIVRVILFETFPLKQSC